MICLQKVSTSFVQEGDLNSLLNDIMEAAIFVTRADRGTLQLIRPGLKDLEIVAQHGFEQSYVDFFSSVSHGTSAVCAVAFQQGERVIVEDVTRSPIFIGTPALDVQLAAGVRSVQSTPLINRRGEMIGMLSTHWSKPYSPNESILRYIDLLARQAADTIESKQAEEALRKSEERQAFLLKLSDAWGALEDAGQTLSIATRMLAEHLGASRVQYFLAEGDPEAMNACGIIKASYGREIPPMTGRYRMADFGIEPTDSMRAKITVVPNVFAEKKLSEEEIASYKAISLGAWMSVPLIRQGRFVAALVIHQKEARDWTPEEIELVKETAERTWTAVERSKTEEALRESELKYRTLSNTLEEKVKERTEELEEAYKHLRKVETVRKQEIHHRIKNNLQVISSLLDLQAEKFRGKKNIEDSQILKAFKESQDRVISMAFIHEELHKGGKVDTLNISDYIEKLANNLLLTYGVCNNGISLDMDIEENIFFDMDMSVPLGIIVNELISNSLKHAFSDRDKGEIQIKLHREKNVECESEDCNPAYVLMISDNGVGIPKDLEIEKLDSLGMQLVTSLVDQLDGEFELKRDNWTEFIIRFTVKER